METKFNLKDHVVLLPKTETPKIGIVVGILQRPNDITYLVSTHGVDSWHYGFELEKA